MDDPPPPPPRPALAPSLPPAGPSSAQPVHDPHAALVAAAQRGDRAALSQLLAALAPAVRRLAAGVVGPRHPDLDDVTQLALVSVARGLPAFRGECPVGGFAARITVRAALEARRRARAAHARTAPLPDGDAGPAGADQVAAGETPDRAAVLARSRALWQAMLDELPEAQAQTILLRVVLDYSLEETAAATEVPVNTVRSRLRLARETLRARIEKAPALAELLGVLR